MSTRNNFDMMRLGLAVSVMLVHAHVLSGAAALEPFARYLSSTYAVWAFFIISGHLIAMSYERSRSVRRFAVKRARRVLPAYVTVVVASALAGLLATTLPPSRYLTSPGVFGYLLANLSFLNFLRPTLPGVFEHNPYGPAVNGALWSVRSELACYALVPLVAWLAGRVGRGAAFVATAALVMGSGAVLFSLQNIKESTILFTLKHAFTDCATCFVLGIGTWYFRDRLRGRWFAAAGAACVALLAARVEFDPWAEFVLRPAILTGAVTFVALGVPYLGNWVRFGDASYGVYIYHFPVIQYVVSVGGFDRSPYAGLGLSVGATLVLAAASWAFVEARWLAPDNHYVRSRRDGARAEELRPPAGVVTADVRTGPSA